MKEPSLSSFVIMMTLAAVLAGCGGGGGGSAGATGDALTPSGLLALDAAAFDFGGSAGDSGGSAGDGGAGGAAGDGAPIRKAVIIITDATGKTASGLTDDNGNYFVKFTGFTAPLVAKVIDAGGNVLTSATEEQPATNKAVRIMINPLTDKIVSDSVVDGVVPGTDKAFNGSKVDLTKFAIAKTNLRTSINAALAAAGVTSTAFDPIKSKYAYDGTGIDAVIESISHTRDPNTGATLLLSKAVSVDQPAVLITAAVPLAASSVALPSSSALTFAKLQAWTNFVNSCLARSPSDATNPCDKATTGPTVISNNYLSSSKDMEEDFKTLFSGPLPVTAGSLHIQNSTVRNPVVLFIGKYPASTATYDDLAVVEMTIKQPSVGSRGPNGAVTDSVEYVQYFIFKRDDTLVGAKAGNWVLHGNQRSYDIAAHPRYDRFKQVNPAKSANSSGNNPSVLFSEMSFFANPNKYDSTTKTWVSANIRAVRVTGPGLPPVTGIVLAPTATAGASNLAIHNALGTVNTSAMTTTNTSSGYRFNGIAFDGSDLYSGYWPTAHGTAGASGSHLHAIPTVTDFSSLTAFALYKFEIFLNSNAGNTTPDAIEYTRSLAPVAKPIVALAMPVNDVSPSDALVTPPQAATSTATLNWTINLGAAPITSAYLFASERTPKGNPTNTATTSFLARGNVAAAYSVNSRPTSIVVNYTGGTSLPAHTTAAGDYREVGIQSWQGRSHVFNQTRWSN